jgi:hypothetical protein
MRTNIPFKVSASRRTRQRGNEMIEFALSCAVLIPLLLWTFINGFNLIRMNECQEIDRDIANQYIHGVDYSTYQAQTVAARLASQFGLQIGSSFTGSMANNSSNSGNVYILLSEIMYVGAGTCASASPCTNEYKYVFVQQIGFGNSSIQFNGVTVASKLGNMTASVSSGGYVQSMLTSTGAVCSNCAGYFQTQLSDGQVAYVVEGFFANPGLSFSAYPAGGIYTATFM